MTRNTTKKDQLQLTFRNIVGKNVIKKGEKRRKRKKKEERDCWLMRGIRPKAARPTRILVRVGPCRLSIQSLGS
jgi:hypothetical protein